MKVGIVGCGIGGMATATLLAEAGHDVTIYERFENPRPIGAGLLLQPTGLAILDRLGLRETILHLGARVDGIDGRTIRGRRVLALRYADLHPALFGVGIHRGAVFTSLFDRVTRAGIAVSVGHDVTGIDQTPAGARLTFTDRNRSDPHDLVVVADGAHSALRAATAAGHRAPIYPWGCLWLTVPDPDRRFGGMLRQRFRDSRVMIGALPVGRQPDAPDGPTLLTIFWSLPLSSIDATRTTGIEAFKAEIGSLWPDLAPLLSDVDDMGAVTSASYRHVALPRWVDGRVVFLGDAAHGTSPQLGQGANLALVDAATLVDSLAEAADVGTGLERYQDERRRITAFYRQASAVLTPFYQSSWAPLGWLRDLTFGPMCRFPPTRDLMLTTLSGLRRSWFTVAAPPPGSGSNSSGIR